MAKYTFNRFATKPGGLQFGMDPYKTGPLQDFRLPWQLGGNPSQESLTRAAINEYTNSVRDLRNKGAASRMENSLAGARGTVAGALRRAGMDPNSLGAIQMGIGAQTDTMVDQQKNEAEIDRSYDFAKVEGLGNVAGLEEQRGARLFQNWADIQQLRLAEEEMKKKKASSVPGVI